MSIKLFFLMAGFSVFFAACYTGPVTIPDGATAAEIVQMGQVAMDRNRLAQAIQYYEAIRLRFPENSEAVVGADYEIAFIHYKQEKYDDAREEFSALLEKYNAPEGGGLPKKYQILSNTVLKKIMDSQKSSVK
ncbi:MAG: tetratricopeptide repeat protein [Spirochaetaceae bacterium]|nr:tetratricopeptide repeat protein [Spirochaetaceae bacterium]